MPEVLDVGAERPPWSPRRRAVTGALAVVVLAAVAGVALWPGGEDGATPPAPTTAPTRSPTGTATRPPDFDEPSPPPPYTPVPIPAGQPAALMLPGGAVGRGALERRDTDAADGPWGLVVRRDDGSFGRHGSVITFPVSAPHAGRPVRVGDADGAAASNQVTWPIDGGYARIRGDLPERDLVAIARTVRIHGGHPVSDPPAGFRAVVAGQYEPSVIREVRFGDLAGAAYGLTYTGVLAATGFEDQVYATAGISAGTVNGHRAVATPIAGGNGTVAWEPVPGVVAFVGYSGTVPFEPAEIARLRELAEGGSYLAAAGWRNLGPVVSIQDNAFGFDDYG